MMENRKNISLADLERYSKMLTTKQVGKLYESKMLKKYKHMICEQQNVNKTYKIFVSYATISSIGIDETEFKNFIQYGVHDENYEELYDVSFKDTNPQGIWVGTMSAATFVQILKRIAELEISEQVEDTISHKQYIQYLYPAD